MASDGRALSGSRPGSSQKCSLPDGQNWSTAGSYSGATDSAFWNTKVTMRSPGAQPANYPSPGSSRRSRAIWDCPHAVGAGPVYVISKPLAVARSARIRQTTAGPRSSPNAGAALTGGWAARGASAERGAAGRPRGRLWLPADRLRSRVDETLPSERRGSLSISKAHLTVSSALGHQPSRRARRALFDATVSALHRVGVTDVAGWKPEGQRPAQPLKVTWPEP